MLKSLDFECNWLAQVFSLRLSVHGMGASVESRACGSDASDSGNGPRTVQIFRYAINLT